MRHYTFELRHDEGLTEDERGLWLDNRERAYEYARDVAHELMRGQEKQARSWCLDIYEDGERIQEILFASIDPTLAKLDTHLQATVEEASAIQRGYRDARSAIRVTLRETRALVARSRGKPYLATERGEPTIRRNPNEGDQPSRRRPG